ncbi:MAG: MFS transporter [Pseudomonadota bacterium]
MNSVYQAGVAAGDAPAARQEPARIAWRVVIISLLTIFLDGFDTTSIGFVAPTLARQWGLVPAAFTPAFVGTSLGAVIGYMISGPLARRFGGRGVIFASVLVFGLGSLLTAFAPNLPMLALLRLLTGIGLGAALPAAVALAAAQCPDRHREMIAVAVTSGIGLGSTFGGVVGGRMIAAYGWESVFILGGVLPALLLPLVWWGLPAERPAPGRAPEGGTIGSLFIAGLALRTTLLWSFSFMLFLAVYALYFWLPTLLLDFGFKPQETPLGTAFLGMGGLAGALLLIPLSARFGAARVLVASSVLGALAIACIGVAALDRQQVIITIVVTGAALLAGTVGQSALAVTLYPGPARTTGIGCAAALGRIGSILGPAAGGLLLSLGKPAREIVLTACIPVLIAAFAMLLLAYVQQRNPS